MEWILFGTGVAVLLVCIFRPDIPARVKAKLRSLLKGGDGGEEGGG